MKMEVVLDRITDGKFATLIAEKEKQEYVVPLSHFPKGIKEGTWLTISVNDDDVTVEEIDYDKTKQMMQKVTDQRQRLLNKSNRSSRFKRK